MAYPYRVMLTEVQGADLRGRVGSGVAPARLLTRARILRKANHGEGGPGWSDMAIAGALEINPSPVLRVRRQVVREGLPATLERKRPDRVYERALDGAQEAHLIALACAETPDGADHWSLRLLADELVRLEVVATIVPGRPARHDPEYVRGGVANLLLMTEPVRGWRAVRVSTQRTRIDSAACIKELVDTHYPAAERIVLVLDQLTTHSPASLSAASPPDAQRLADRLEIHHTPKHGSWRNMADLELRVPQRPCLRQRCPDRPTMRQEVGAWAHRRNDQTRRIDWQFTTADARIKLRRLSPAFED